MTSYLNPPYLINFFNRIYLIFKVFFPLAFRGEDFVFEGQRDFNSIEIIEQT